MATGVVGLGGAVVTMAAALLLLAGGARADCFDYCFKNCIANDRSMADYCNYACDKICQPGVSLAGGGGMRCPLSCARASCGRLLEPNFEGRADDAVDAACFGQCYDGCKSKTTLPRPLRATGAGAGDCAGEGDGDGDYDAPGPVLEFPASEPDPGPVTEFPASEPNPACECE